MRAQEYMDDEHDDWWEDQRRDSLSVLFNAFIMMQVGMGVGVRLGE